MRRRALCTGTVHVSSWNGLGLRTWHFWRVDTTCSLSINKHTSYWESSLWIQRMAATAPQNSEPREDSPRDHGSRSAPIRDQVILLEEHVAHGSEGVSLGEQGVVVIVHAHVKFVLCSGNGS